MRDAALNSLIELYEVSGLYRTAHLPPLLPHRCQSTGSSPVVA